MKIFSMFAVLTGWVLVSTATAATLLYDFGDSNQQTLGNYNNIVVNPPGVLSILNSLDSTGAPTGISVTASGFFNGSNQTGTNAANPVSGVAATIFDPQATRDNAFGHAAAFGTNPLTPQATVLFSGLDGSGATTYDFTFFAARIGVTDIRDALYDVTGANNGSAVLNASGNTSNVAIVSGITPTAAGNITLLVSPGPNNNSASRFYFLGAIQLVSNTVPEPTSLGLACLSCLWFLRHRGR